MSTRSEQVKKFTEESLNKELPNHPRVMTRDEVLFVARMNLEELLELLSTVLTVESDEFGNSKVIENPKDLLRDLIEKAREPVSSCNPIRTNVEIMAEQVDAFVDIDYYNCNAAAKVGFNVDKVFNLVHQANMNKKFSDGTFHKDSSGKIIKPPGWVEPNVAEEVSKWIDYGTWNYC